MEIIYTDYAEETLIEREISKREIEMAIANPDEVVPGKHNRMIAHKIIGDKLLRVILEPGEKAYIVITAYYTTIGRYIKNENNL